VMLTAASGAGVVVVWGIWQWDYFSTSPHAGSEDWFGKNTASGGADKLGHLYSCYVASHGFSYLKYLIALKLNGFDFAGDNWLRYIELHGDITPVIFLNRAFPGNAGSTRGSVLT